MYRKEKLFLYEILIISLIFSIITIEEGEEEEDESFLYKCMREDLKLGDICAIKGSLTFENDDSEIVTNKYLYIKKICSGNKICLPYDIEFPPKNRTFYSCFEKLIKRKIGESCSINEECYTNQCSLDVCLGIDFEGECTDNPEGCKPGLSCEYTEEFPSPSQKTRKICVEYAYENEDCGWNEEKGYNVSCFPGYICQIRDNGSNSTGCKKWGTFDINKEVTDERLCKSGLALIDNEVDKKQKCVLVEEDGECDEETHRCTPQVTGIGISPDMPTEMNVKCKGGIDKMYVCPINRLRVKVFQDYINEFNKIYDDKILRKKEVFKVGSFGNRKLSKLYRKYKRINYLMAYEVIDENGNVKHDKSCEYDFIWKYLSTNKIIFNKIYFFLIFVLLFL